MNRIIASLVVPIFMHLCAYSQKKINTDNIKSLVVRYDPSVLRIPGNSLPFGISALMQNGDVYNTKGYLNGELRWINFKIEVDGGSVFLGDLHFDQTAKPLKNNGITVRIYSRKSKELLHEQQIMYNYPIDIELYPKNEFDYAPKNRIVLGMDVQYNNGAVISEDIVGLTNPKNVYLSVSGGFYNLGAINIEPDPFKIVNHTVEIVGLSPQNPEVSDTLRFLLDYRTTYKKSYTVSHGANGVNGMAGSNGSSVNCHGEDGGHGQRGQNGYNGVELDMFVDVYYDTIINQELLYVEIKDLWSGDIDRFLINTDGGSLYVSNKGGNGGNGGNGGSGGAGINGKDGEWFEEKTTNKDGDTTINKYRGAGETGGDGGRGGDGGDGGFGGQGGYVTITFTKAADWYQHLITIYNSGGEGGHGGSYGHGGSGGKGGAGSPQGEDGRSGWNGRSGDNGYDGARGFINTYIIE